MEVCFYTNRGGPKSSLAAQIQHISSEVDGVTIRDVIENLEKAYPGLKERICDEENNIRRFVNVFVNDEDIRFLEDAATQVKPGDEVSIVPAIAGG